MLFSEKIECCGIGEIRNLDQEPLSAKALQEAKREYNYYKQFTWSKLQAEKYKKTVDSILEARKKLKTLKGKARMDFIGELTMKSIMNSPDAKETGFMLMAFLPRQRKNIKYAEAMGFKFIARFNNPLHNHVLDLYGKAVNQPKGKLK
jgi:hypothetical protein